MADDRSELSDVRAVAEALADVLAERGLVIANGSVSSSRVLDALEVARMLGRERQWVYDHAAELGGFRYGDGPRARLGFDLATIQRWKRARQDRLAAPRRPAPKSPTHKPAPDVRAELIPYEPLDGGRTIGRDAGPLRDEWPGRR